MYIFAIINYSVLIHKLRCSALILAITKARHLLKPIYQRYTYYLLYSFTFIILYIYIYILVNNN